MPVHGYVHHIPENVSEEMDRALFFHAEHFIFEGLTNKLTIYHYEKTDTRSSGRSGRSAFVWYGVVEWLFGRTDGTFGRYHRGIDCRRGNRSLEN